MGEKIMYYLLFLWCISFPYVTCIWRMQSPPLPTNHYVNFDGTVKYHSTNPVVWVWKCDNGTQTPISAPTNCSITYKDSLTASMHCEGNGKYMITKPCPDCDTELDRTTIVKLTESARCFFWGVEVDRGERRFVLQISIRRVQTSYDDHHSKHITQLFKSRMERPVLTTIVGSPVLIANEEYNSTGHFWKISIDESEIFKSEFIKIDSFHKLGMLGCVVMPTVVFISHNDLASMIVPDTLLRPATAVQRKTFQSSCLPHVAVLATMDHLFLTTDEFVTSRKMGISGDIAATYGVEVSDIAITLGRIYILLSGHLYEGRLDETNLVFKKLNVSNSSEILIGLATSPNCLINPHQNPYYTLESDGVVAWSRGGVYYMDRGLNQWRHLKLDIGYTDYHIKEVALGVIPGNLAATLVNNHHRHLILCTFVYGQPTNSIMSCKNSTFLSQIPNTGSINIASITSVLPSLLVWTNSKIYYFYDDGIEKGEFPEINLIKSVVFNYDHSQWLVRTTDNTIYFGNGRTKTMLRLSRVDAKLEVNMSYIFSRGDGQAVRLVWSDGDVIRENYPLLQEVYSSVHQTQANPGICDHIGIRSNRRVFWGNVINLVEKTGYSMVNFTMIHPTYYKVDLKFRTNQESIIVLPAPSVAVSTHQHPAMPDMCIQSKKIKISSNCNDTSGVCATGLAVVGLSGVTLDQTTTCMLPHEELIFVNITCPVGLSIRLRKPGGNYCSENYMNEECVVEMGKESKFSPTLTLSSFGVNQRVLTETLELTEVTGKTGFGLQDKNPLLKDCYLCSNIEISPSPSKVILQTPDRACPCKSSKYSTRHWIGNISFEDFLTTPPPVVTDFVFEVKVIGTSFCDLKTRFTLRFPAHPSVPFVFWEYTVILVFVLITLAVLVMSYDNYISFMKETKKKML